MRPQTLWRDVRQRLGQVTATFEYSEDTLGRGWVDREPVKDWVGNVSRWGFPPEFVETAHPGVIREEESLKWVYRTRKYVKADPEASLMQNGVVGLGGGWVG